MWTQIRLLLKEQSDLGPHCLQKLLLKSQADDKADDNNLGFEIRCGTEICVIQMYISGLKTVLL